MKNVLNYFVRKAFGFKSTATADDKTLYGNLLRIKRNIQGVYDWLYGRLSAEHLPRRMPMKTAVLDPNGYMGVEPLDQNTDTLLAHLELLNGRKISNGYTDGTPADDGLPDGVSLARILCDSTLQPTELVDDNVGWVCEKDLSIVANKIILNCTMVNANTLMYNKSVVKEVYMPCVKEFKSPTITPRWLQGIRLQDTVEFPCLECIKDLFQGWKYFLCDIDGMRVCKLPKLHTIDGEGIRFLSNCKDLEEIYLERAQRIGNSGSDTPNIFCDLPALKKVVFGQFPNITYRNGGGGSYSQIPLATNGIFKDSPNLLHLEIGEDTAISMYLNYWSPTLNESNMSLFLSNFREYIAERLAVLPQG